MSSHLTNKPAAPKGHSLRYYAWLALQLATRDIAVRYRGTSLGWLWALFTPLLMLGVYTFAFKYIFKVRWPGVGDSPVDFALQLFAGLLIFQAAADCWGRSSRIIAEQPHLVKKVVFPLRCCLGRLCSMLYFMPACRCCCCLLWPPCGALRPAFSGFCCPFF